MCLISARRAPSFTSSLHGLQKDSFKINFNVSPGIQISIIAARYYRRTFIMIILPYITIKYDFCVGKLDGGYFSILHRRHVAEGCNNTADTSCLKKKYSFSSRAYEAVRESWPL
jgi:hypothetical protein